ncbi:RNA_pol_Rpb2_6 domain-containing protein [Trichonephila clavata]|uniref:DNA-directed RNA polymerase n=1 Tax=Trichonephila clavata TaxID=2740835 RepID=A0A8X6F162_TRICU|nr:RNA_pol_Rpb2_6 domain-containing protein [Trichonephila clavata]
MLGSKLDIAIRKEGQKEFQKIICVDSHAFETADIGFTFFVINGCLRQVPYFFTNDPTNVHIVRNNIVRCYTYDSDDRGRELSYYVTDNKLCVIRNDGTESVEDVSVFFDFCPYPIDQEAYMSFVYKNNTFDIDHLANKVVVSPGHLFVKLFIKYLYPPLKENDWVKVKSKLSMVVKSIETGCLLHVLSRKTVYFKESKSVGKMVSMPLENYRELGMNGEVYVEKNTGCYRDVNLQTYPLNPYISHLIIRQISSKVKNNAALAFHPSYIGFLCILGTFETKNVGRTNMMVRHTFVSSCDEMDPVAHKQPGQKLYKYLNLEPATTNNIRVFYVVINEACIPITQSCFHSIDLMDIKKIFKFIECYVSGNFIFIRYKVGLLFKKFNSIWVTPRDEAYWALKLYQLKDKFEIVEKFGYDYITGYHVDLNPYFKHNAFPKNILAFNALKNAVLATDPSYSLYFMDTISAYMLPTKQHHVVLPPVDDGFSSHFVLKIPKVIVAYMSFMGNNQEDCIVMNESLKSFNCYRFYTIRVKFNVSDKLVFYPVLGDNETDFLGTIAYHGEETIQVEPLSVHVKIMSIKNNIFNLHFSKYPFKILQYNLTKDRLSICVNQFHETNTGDKLCSLHGQKGVIRKMDKMPTFDEETFPDLIINPFSLFRMTMGQIKEGIELGNGKDAHIVRNSDGKIIPGGKAFYAGTLYFAVSYFSNEHFYAPTEYVRDKINDQPVKGRSRAGGMRLGNMELLNGLRGNGIASCFEEKFFEHGDRTMVGNVMIPKSTFLVKEDARFFKSNLDFTTVPCVKEI